MDIFYLIYYVGDMVKGMSTLLIRIPFVADTRNILYLIIDKGDLYGHKGEVRT